MKLFLYSKKILQFSAGAYYRLLGMLTLNVISFTHDFEKEAFEYSFSIKFKTKHPS